MNNNFSENLKKIRKDHNLSQEQLADELGVSRQAISKWESSVAYPEMDKIIALCDKFNLNIDDLLHKDIREIKGEEESKKKINKTIDDFLKFITDTINLFSSMNFKSKIKCLFEQIVIALILFTISIVIVVFSSLFIKQIFHVFPYNIDNFLSNTLIFLVIIFCVVSSIIIITHIFKTRYLDYYNKVKNTLKNNEDNKTSELNNNDKIEFKEEDNKIIIRDPKHSEYKFINGLFKVIVLVFKFFTLCFALFLCFILICLLGAFIVSFLTYKTGFFFIGLLITLLSVSVADIIIILFLFNFILNRNNDKKKMIWSFIISMIGIGIGSGLIFIGTLNFQVLDNNETMLKKYTKEYEMNNSSYIDYYSDFEIRYVESDINNIKLEYEINRLCKLNDEIHKDGAIHVWAYCPNPTKLMKSYIDNINNKKIISINSNINSITIYASKENIIKLKNNREKFIDNEKEYYNTIDEYENNISTLNKEIEELRTTNEQYENKIDELKQQIETYTTTNTNN